MYKTRVDFKANFSGELKSVFKAKTLRLTNMYFFYRIRLLIIYSL